MVLLCRRKRFDSVKRRGRLAHRGSPLRIRRMAGGMYAHGETDPCPLKRSGRRVAPNGTRPAEFPAALTNLEWLRAIIPRSSSNLSHQGAQRHGCYRDRPFASGFPKPGAPAGARLTNSSPLTASERPTSASPGKLSDVWHSAPRTALAAGDYTRQRQVH